MTDLQTHVKWMLEVKTLKNLKSVIRKKQALSVDAPILLNLPYNSAFLLMTDRQTYVK